ncbi:dihydrolipoamide acetyltransferase family protein [Bacillus horti]|uniref:Dihydrolipoamide acetyltransferase component of pyruvate dehydrogenase complex n=1 Tax=Caldalkalibacillus horti TaxID=77523 RepID=A0ABT9W162_9BACI|nr:2-oxoisovalerate dehydrogenase E2 component (dihydrolipoyl transacylase) [Bacillus horti]
MSTKVTMPQLGESVTEGTISKWLVKVGDKVNKYDSLCEVMTDKVNAEVPSSYTGTIVELVAAEDETVEVGGLICLIQEEGAEAQAQPTTNANQENTSTSSQDHSGKPEGEDHIEQGDQSMKGRYSPAVLKLSQEHGIDLKQVQGTGKGGRITRKDLQQIIESGNIPAATTDQPTQQEAQSDTQSVSKQAEVSNSGKSFTSPTQKQSYPASQSGDVEIPVSGIRKAIANKMLQSKHEAPHAWTMIEVDVTNLVEYRNKMKQDFKQKEGVNLTFLPFFIKATVEALKEFPMINSQWAGDKIIQKKDINISIAVATEDALYVPVIKRADEKSILGLARSIDELAQKTRNGKLGTEDMQGGTFTVNNTGSFGSVQSMPIINYPQAAILSVEAIVKRPVVKDNMIGIRDMMNLCMSLDHRVLDGLICGRFLQSIKQKLEAMGEGTSLS